MSTTGRPLSDLVGERIARFPASGEINRRIEFYIVEKPE